MLPISTEAAAISANHPTLDNLPIKFRQTYEAIERSKKISKLLGGSVTNLFDDQKYSAAGFQEIIDHYNSIHDETGKQTVLKELSETMNYLNAGAEELEDAYKSRLQTKKFIRISLTLLPIQMVADAAVFAAGTSAIGLAVFRHSLHWSAPGFTYSNFIPSIAFSRSLIDSARISVAYWPYWRKFRESDWSIFNDDTDLNADAKNNITKDNVSLRIAEDIACGALSGIMAAFLLRFTSREQISYGAAVGATGGLIFSATSLIALPILFSKSPTINRLANFDLSGKLTDKVLQLYGLGQTGSLDKNQTATQKPKCC